MARILAIDWDQQETRCILAEARGQQIKVLSATSVPLLDVEEGGSPHPDISGSLRAALADHRTGRIATIVGVNRASVELLNLTLPPAKDAELARLVFNQALREASTLGDDAALDFVPMNDDPLEPRDVIAAVLPGSQRKRVEETCSAAGLRPTRIVLRPLAAASLFARTTSPPERVSLLVNLVADEADLTVLVEGRVAFLRTVRLPQNVGEDLAAERLSAEITRTLLVAQQGPLGGNCVEHVYVYGGPGEHQRLVEQLGEDLQLPVTVVDPFATADVSGVELPGGTGRFASLLGMVLDESRSTHGIDFLHPRRPPKPPNRRRNFLTIAAGVAALALAGGYYYWDLLNKADDDLRQLAAELKKSDELVKRGLPEKQVIAAVRAWKAGEVVWLDELRDLSLRMPPSHDVIVLRMTIAGGRGGGGTINFQGLARDSAIVGRIDRSLYDDHHRVTSRRVGEHPRSDDYSWLFERAVTVSPRDKESYLSPPTQGASP